MKVYEKPILEVTRLLVEENLAELPSWAYEYQEGGVGFTGYNFGLMGS